MLLFILLPTDADNVWVRVSRRLDFGLVLCSSPVMFMAQRLVSVRWLGCGVQQLTVVWVRFSRKSIVARLSLMLMLCSMSLMQLVVDSLLLWYRLYAVF